jgi:hypothetical protein
MIWEPPSALLPAPGRVEPQQLVVEPRRAGHYERMVTGATLPAAYEKAGSYWIANAPGMVFVVQERNGRRYAYFALRFKVEGKMRHIDLGAYPKVSLADARRLYQRLNPSAPGDVRQLDQLRQAAAKVRPLTHKPPTIVSAEDAERLRETPGVHRVDGASRLALVVRRKHLTSPLRAFFEWRWGSSSHLSLGPLSSTSVGEARVNANRLLQCLQAGGDPRAEWTRTHPRADPRRGPDGLTERERDEAFLLSAKASGLMEMFTKGDGGGGDA